MICALLALAIVAQSPPLPSTNAAPMPATITAADGQVYQVTYTPMPMGWVPPLGSTSAPQIAARTSTSTTTPAKATPQAIAPQFTAMASPQQAVQYVQPQPRHIGLQLQQQATVELKPPCCLDRMIGELGRRMYERGLPRMRIRQQPATLQTATFVLAPAPAPVYQAFASPQQ